MINLNKTHITYRLLVFIWILTKNVIRYSYLRQISNKEYEWACNNFLFLCRAVKTHTHTHTHTTRTTHTFTHTLIHTPHTETHTHRHTLTGTHSHHHLLFDCNNTRAQRETMIQHIGTWPTSKQDLINKHRKIFSWFVESIDFDDMQQSD